MMKWRTLRWLVVLLHGLAINMKTHTSKPTKSYRDPNFFLPHENVETNRSKG